MEPERWQRVRQVFEHAASLDAPERARYLENACPDDAELRHEVESLLVSHSDAGSTFLRTPAAQLLSGEKEHFPTRTDTRLGVYQILDEIGRGGMGEVYRAVRADGQYQKEVAVKLVRGGFDSRAVLERFLNERQILATLDHPNIARLLDGGTTSDGVPYLVMELIQGQSLDAYCDGRSINTSQRLQLFRQVCHAVQYAHQRLVIHRDIKPNNIMVTSDGTPKLLDFGIAKILDPGAQVEVTQSRAMTPEYASPEQVGGKPITTATDVYSLGVVLYELLTGHSPYPKGSSTPLELAHAICESDPVRPSTIVLRAPQTRRGEGLEAQTAESISRTREGTPVRLKRRLQGDLDNIVLKAMRKDPQRRYASVEHLAEDVRRHLEGLPVAAAPDSVLYRANKFVRRNKIGVVAAAIVVLAILGGVLSTIRQARIAEANAQRAERHFNDVRKLANSLLSEIHEAIKVLPGSTPARKLIVDRALEYLDGLSRESSGDPALQRELAQAYLQVGQVQGGIPGVPNLGDTVGALRSFQKALAIRQSLAQAQPDNVGDQIALAEAYHYLSDLRAAYLGEVESAFADCAKAVAIGEALYQAHPDDRKIKMRLAADYEKLADIQGGGNGISANMARFREGLENHYKALALVEPIAKDKPDDSAWIGWLADLNYKLQNDLIQTGDRVEAMRRAELTAKLFQGLAEQENDAVAQRELGVGYSAIATLLLMDGRFADALEYSRKELQILEPVSAADPTNTEYSMDLPSTRGNLGYLMYRNGHPGGIEILQRAVAEITRIDAAAPNTETRVVLGEIRLKLGSVLERKGDWDGALEAYTHALEPFQASAAHDAADLNDRLKAAGIRNRIATIHLKKGDLGSAGSTYEQVRSVVEPVASSTSMTLVAVYLAFDNYAGLGDLAVARASRTRNTAESAQFWIEAQSWYRRSLEAAKRIPNRAVIDPAGFESRDMQTITAGIAKCERALGHQHAIAPP